MKLGNGLGASGAYFLKVFWVGGSEPSGESKLLRSGETECVNDC